jgi:PDZ domain-containing protein/aspartyl protease
MRLALLSALLLLVAAPLPAAGSAVQDLHETLARDPHAEPEFQIPGGASEISFPFQLINQHVVLPVMVNGQGPFQIILDTGMPMDGMILYGSDKVEALHLSYLDNVQVQVGGAGGKGEDKPARMALGLALGIGDFKVLNIRTVVLSPLPGFGVYHDGVIGAALFHNFVVSIDNDRSVITLRQPAAFDPAKGAAVIPLTLDHGMPFIEAKVKLTASAEIPVNLVVDLGASHPISLNGGTGSRITVPQGSIPATIGRGLSGDIRGRVGRINSLQLANLTLASVVATFPDQANGAPRKMDGRDGNLGNGILSRFNVTFDYPGRRMVLEPGKRFSEPFEWDMSGMQAEPTGAGSVRVREVLPGSPAALAGIQEDDRLMKIAGEEVTEATYFSLRERLRKDGETVSVEVRRGDKQIGVSLKLRRLV